VTRASRHGRRPASTVMVAARSSTTMTKWLGPAPRLAPPLAEVVDEFDGDELVARSLIIVRWPNGVGDT
jgi:hypothetical protein